MAKISHALVSRRLRAAAIRLCDWPSRADLAAHLGVAPRSVAPYLAAIRAAGGVIGRAGDRYGLAMGPGEVGGLMCRIDEIVRLRAPKSQGIRLNPRS